MANHVCVYYIVLDIEHRMTECPGFIANNRFHSAINPAVFLCCFFKDWRLIKKVQDRQALPYKQAWWMCLSISKRSSQKPVMSPYKTGSEDYS